MSDSDPAPPDQERLLELLEAWFEKVEAGEEPDVAEICAGSPELAPVLLRMVDQESELTDALPVLAPPRGEERGLGVEWLGDFRVLSFLGAGGMGQVHLARQESLGGRLVALKVLHATAAQDARAVQRFQREAEIAGGLDHPNIVPVYAVGEDEGYAYLAMKWLSGPALDQLTESLDARECARIGIAIGRALHEAHESGVVHRDVKPGNVMLDGATPYILDFGLARARADVTVTRQGTVPGTLPYMSPEQLRAGTSRSTLDGRTDVYSLGATLYELVSGRCPFVGDDPEVMIREILFNDPPKLGLGAADTDLQTIVMRAMDKDRERRFASAGDMADDLERYLSGMPLVSRPAGPMTRIIKKVRRHKQASMWIGGLLVGFMVLMTFITLKLIEERQARGKAATEVAAVLAEGRFREAARLLRLARGRYGGGDGLLALAYRIDLGRRLEDLVDRVLEGGELQFIEAALSELEGRLREAGFGDEGRTVRYRIVRGITALRRRPVDVNGALAAVEGLRGRDVAAIRAFAQGETLDQLPGVGARGVEEHVFTQAVMRSAERSRDERLEEIQAAERLPGGSGDDRVLYAYATWLAEDVTRASEAEVAFKGLARDGVYRRSVLRNLLRQQIILTDFAGARRSAKAFREAVPDEAEWSPVEACVLAELNVRLGEVEAASALLTGAYQRYPRNWTLLMMLHRDVARTNPTEALALLGEARRVARLRTEQEQAEARSLLMRVVLAGSDPALIEEVAADAEAFLLDAEDRLARADGLYAQGACERRLGNVRDARGLLERALEIEPDYVGPINELGTLAIERRDWPLGRKMLIHLDGVLRHPGPGERGRPEVDLLVSAALEAIFTGMSSQDWPLTRRRAEDVMQLAEDRDDLGRGISNGLWATLLAVYEYARGAGK